MYIYFYFWGFSESQPQGQHQLPLLMVIYCQMIWPSRSRFPFSSLKRARYIFAAELFPERLSSRTMGDWSILTGPQFIVGVLGWMMMPIEIVNIPRRTIWCIQWPRVAVSYIIFLSFLFPTFGWTLVEKATAIKQMSDTQDPTTTAVCCVCAREKVNNFWIARAVDRFVASNKTGKIHFLYSAPVNWANPSPLIIFFFFK